MAGQQTTRRLPELYNLIDNVRDMSNKSLVKFVVQSLLKNDSSSRGVTPVGD
ncbi:hypothetical protein QJS10_CPB04g00827 [Acorus calamus]|uniref:Uncharacterized protein n=1 Tax=Acorus calamus TaxID=4465 RepID=A0AAV9F285_ACOCL|nr:hypothetical protein QJS10_CPB04g00827 [Acorus calamus]